MSEISRIPEYWNQYGMRPHYFMTYFGDIYHGLATECPGYEDGFFIIPNHKLIEFNKLDRNKIQTTDYQNFGIEIKDNRIFHGIIPGNRGVDRFSEDGYPPVPPINKNFRRMFVFGAGASTHCCFGESKEKFRMDPFNPPMGYEIFNDRYDEIIKKYPAAKYSIPDFESKGNDIERCLEDEWSIYRKIYNPRLAVQHINLQFYLQELFSSISMAVVDRYFRHNLYSLFTNKIQNHCASNPEERPVMVSFNYDTILEDFIEQAFRSSFTNLRDYIDWDNRHIVVLKPHGSANWGWKFDMTKVQKSFGKPYSQVLYESQIEPWKLYYEMLGDIKTMVSQSSYSFENSVTNSNVSRFTLNKQRIRIMKDPDNEYYYPALLLPYKDKDEFVMPYDHQLAMETLLGHIEEIFLIGWKGGEDLFNLKIQQHATKLKRIIIVNPEIETVKSNLSKFIELKNIEIHHVNNFEEFVLYKLDNYLI